MLDEKQQIVISILNNAVKLDSPCWNCTESYRDYNCDYSIITSITVEECEYCNNKRFQLTETGEAIMDLIKRHGS